MSMRYCYWPYFLVGKMRLLVHFMHISVETGPSQGHFKVIHRWGPPMDLLAVHCLVVEALFTYMCPSLFPHPTL